MERPAVCAGDEPEAEKEGSNLPAHRIARLTRLARNDRKRASPPSAIAARAETVTGVVTATEIFVLETSRLP